MKRLIAVSLAFIPLAGCWPFDQAPVQEEEQTSSVPETKNVVYRGVLRELGASIYMEGTHKLELEDGRFVLLEANGLVLDDYMNEDVEVFGSTRPTVEGDAIIMRVERIANVTISSEAVSSAAPEESSSSEASSVVSSEAASSVAPVITSRAPTPPARSSVAPKPVASSAAPVVTPPTSSAPSDPLAAKTATMAKAKIDAGNWTQEYCSPVHLAFCFPIHKNWYFASFGATSSSLWHVEVGPSSVEVLGDGPLVVALVSGAASVPDGTVNVEGEIVIGIRAWSNNRHFEIRAPKALEASVRYITQELKAAPAPIQ